MLSQNIRSACCAEPRNSRHPIGRVSAQSDEIRDLLGVDTISRANFGGTNPGHLTRTNGKRIIGVLGRKLEHVAIAACDENGAAPALFLGNRGGNEIVGLVTRCFGCRKAAGSHEPRQEIELLDQIIVELASALISRKLLVAVSRRLQSVPTDKHCARLLLPIEPHQEIRETKDSTGRSAAAPQDSFG